MDLASLAVRSGALGAYVSLGVVEHDPAGPGAIVAEAARVLAPGGRLLLSVPYWNGVRKLCAPHLVREGRRLRAAGGEFYQFAFSRREVRDFLEAHGFRVLSFHPYDPARMPRTLLKRLVARLRRGDDRAPAAASSGPERARAAGSALRGAIKRLLYGEVSLRLFAHMILAVAVRT
jgi:SAM-dependent methyltransferase